MTPTSQITLFASKLDITNKYVLYYSSGSLIGVVNSVSTSRETFDNCYWIRENVSFRCNGNINDLKKYNYCVYSNPSPNGNVKEYGAFIVNFTYINDAMTLINIVTDSWLTYLPYITFNNSPMIQCHPTRDYEKTVRNYNSENVNVMLFPETLTPIPFSDGVDDSKDRILATGLIHIKPDMNLNELAKRTASYIGARNGYGSEKETTAWGNITQAVQDEADSYFQWFEQNLTSDICSFQGIYQRPTTVFAKDEANLLKNILDGLAICEMEHLFVSAYLIPGIFADALQGFSGGTAITRQFPRVGIGAGSEKPFTRRLEDIKWLKILYSPQFNNLEVNFFGESKQLPYRILTEYRDFGIVGGNLKIQYDIKATFNETGCATLTTYLSDDTDSVSLNPICMISSPQWDRVNIPGFAAKTLSESIEAGLASGNQISRLIANIVSSVANKGEVSLSYKNKYLRGLYAEPSNVSSLMNLYETDKPLLQEAALNLAYRDVERATFGKTYTNKIPTPSIQLPTYPTNISGIQEIGEGNIWQQASRQTSSITGYLELAPPIVYAYSYPNDDGIDILNRYFGTYGYNFNGDIQPIEVHNDTLSWVFYRTMDCNLVGKEVPQENLYQIKAMFDNGVFIFQNSVTYKDLSNAKDNHY